MVCSHSKRRETMLGKYIGFREKIKLQEFLQLHFVLVLSTHGTFGITKWYILPVIQGWFCISLAPLLLTLDPSCETQEFLSLYGTEPCFLSWHKGRNNERTEHREAEEEAGSVPAGPQTRAGSLSLFLLPYYIKRQNEHCECQYTSLAFNLCYGCCQK